MSTIPSLCPQYVEGLVQPPAQALVAHARFTSTRNSLRTFTIGGGLLTSLGRPRVTWADSVKAVLWIVSIGALLFLSAGTLDWPNAWIFMGEFVVGGLAVTLWLAWRDPGLLKERMGGPFQKGQAFWDKVFMAFIIVVWFAWLVLMALDAKRWNLSHMPKALNYAGAVLIPIGFFIVWLTFRENSFAAPVIKIQKDRGQRVISTGPYRIVRHPMYAGGLLYMIGMPFLLGSWLGVLVLPMILGALSVRIFIEEAALRKGLPGYGDYAARVRYRLIPGVW
jgi:protein-S-isoprenylcysteine O-methyltransferase Ste14